MDVCLDIEWMIPGTRGSEVTLHSKLLWIVVLLLFATSGLLYAQTGIFIDNWVPKQARVPPHQPSSVTTLAPASIISVDFADTLFRIPPYICGYNQPVHQNGRFDLEPQAVRHTKNLEAQVLRYPGGTAAMTFFWDKRDFEGPPEDVDTYIRSGEVDDNFRFGMTGGDFFSLSHYYNFLDSVPSMTGILVVNYGYARYGRSEHPVQQAAHYAAEWVRYDKGRTRFWEIGNELSGRWTPGHTIDVSKNKDGQPETITGDLYAEHFRIFADSMKAAAAEFGHVIYLGGVLSHNESSWNREFLENASDVADFAIVHEYYGDENVTDPIYAVNSADALGEQSLTALKDISSFARQPLPLVMTEWNTKDAGQNDRCIYGMSNIRGIRNIIQSGIGLACRHTLIHSNARGLINNAQVYDPELGNWLPRSSFFYFYYLSKILGDTWHGKSEDFNDTIEVLPTSFRSGEAGLVLLNKSEKSEIIALNMRHYQAYGKYYIYSLVPEGNNPFNEKVKVNGKTNGYYPAGGPFNYEEIQARSMESEGLIKIELPPFSANYVLVEGQRTVPVAPVEVNVEIYHRIGDSTVLLPDVLVALDSECKFSKETGLVSFMLSPGVHTLELQKNGYDNIIRKVGIAGDTVLRDTLQKGVYRLELLFIDQESLIPVEDLSVSIGEEMRISDANGRVMFDKLTGGDRNLLVEGSGYQFSGTVHLYSDTMHTILLEKATYDLEISIIDAYSGNSLNGIEVTIGTEKVISNLDGRALFTLASGEYRMICSDTDYVTSDQMIELLSDSTMIVAMEAIAGDVTFKVYSGITPLNGVDVVLGQQTSVTNALGMCSFTNITTKSFYNYRMNCEGYADVADSLYLMTDTVVEIQMLPVWFNQSETPPTVSVFPVPAIDHLCVESGIPLQAVHLITIEGRNIASVDPGGGNEILFSLAGLDQGIYILVIETEASVQREKVLIKN